MKIKIVSRDKVISNKKELESYELILDEEDNGLQYGSEKECEREGGNFCYFYDEEKPSKSKTIPTKTVGDK